jgi:peptide/nickel transport system permease protein
MTDLAMRQPASLRPGAAMSIGSVVVLALLLVGVVSIVWTPYPIESFDVGAALQDPGEAHWLGTDPLGRDVLSLIMKSELASFVVAAAALVIGGAIGVPLGLAAARWPRLAGSTADGANAVLVLFPALVAAVVLATILGPSAVVLMLAIGIANIGPLSSAVRRAVQRFGSRGYLDAARLAGLSPWEALRRHVMPQIVTAVAAEAVMLLGAGMIAEAGLSYIGLGIQPPTASFGLMLHDAQSYIAAKPLLVIIPGAVLTVAVVALRLVARGIRARAGAGGQLGAA